MIMMKTIERVFLTLLPRRNVRGRVIPTNNDVVMSDLKPRSILDENNWIGLIPVDIWVMILSEWIDCVRCLTALEEAVGKQYWRKWIIGKRQTVNTPCGVKMHELENFLCWKQAHGMNFAEVILMQYSQQTLNMSIL
jgi:hypothetical protein